ncbi:MAG: DUF3341 domain-containing protein [Verrucomicrobiota bacterium]
MSQNRKVYGIGAEFASAADLMHAAEKIRDQGFSKWDVHTPFPIHGMDAAMGLGKSRLSAFVFCGGLTGLLTGVCLTTIPSLGIYPMIVHGKPFTWATLPAFFPIIFELTVLLSALTAVGTMLALNQLPKWYHPVFNWDRFKKVTDDGFFIVIEARDPKFSEERTKSLLEKIGARNVTLIND